MIYLTNINNNFVKEYLNSNSNNVFAVRIKSLINAYGEYDNIIDIWYQCDSQNRVTAYIVKYGCEIIADIIYLWNVSEIIDLCRLSGGKVLMCRNLNSVSQQGIVMKLDRIITHTYDYPFSHNINLKEYYRILELNKSKSFPLPDFENFYVDLNHRLRKNCAEIMGAYSDNKLVSCCVATAINDISAVISGVATIPQFHKKGFGTKVVVEMCGLLMNNGIKNIYLQRNKSENYSFYRKIGFQDVSEFEQIIL